MNKCPFLGLCGGCQYDFSSQEYLEVKRSLLPCLNFTSEPIWFNNVKRRRANFAFNNGVFGFYRAKSKDVIQIDYCMNLSEEINEIIPYLKKILWPSTGSVLITKCDNGIDVSVNANIDFFSKEFKQGVDKLPCSIIRFSWNGKKIRNYIDPIVHFDDKEVLYPCGAFLQPTIETEQYLRNMVVKNIANAKHVADLFCGLGNFTFVTKAVGFDIVGNGIKRDLFKNPLTINMLNQYEVVIMDPPRAGALAQTKELAKSNVRKIIYVSCNPMTFERDLKILQSVGYIIKVLIPVDQFIGSDHWELFCVLEK